MMLEEVRTALESGSQDVLLQHFLDLKPKISCVQCLSADEHRNRLGESLSRDFPADVYLPAVAKNKKLVALW